jgi:hypothetical protein
MLVEARKYVFCRHRHYKFYVSEEAAFSGDLEKKVDCAACGKRIKISRSYTSKQIYTPNGISTKEN